VLAADAVSIRTRLSYNQRPICGSESQSFQLHLNVISKLSLRHSEN
jgi:hypothetical protein